MEKGEDNGSIDSDWGSLNQYLDAGGCQNNRCQKRTDFRHGESRAVGMVFCLPVSVDCGISVLSCQKRGIQAHQRKIIGHVELVAQITASASAGSLV